MLGSVQIMLKVVFVFTSAFLSRSSRLYTATFLSLNTGSTQQMELFFSLIFSISSHYEITAFQPAALNSCKVKTRHVDSMEQTHKIW